MSETTSADTEPGGPNRDPRTTKPEDDELSVFELLIVLVKHKFLLLGLPVAAGIAGLIYSLMLPNVYTASTKLLPPQQSASASSAMLAQLGGLGSLVGAAGGYKSSTDLFVGMLKSRTVGDSMVQRFELAKTPGMKYPSEARQTLMGVTNITTGKDGFITIEVDDKDPKRAAEIANAYVDELMKLTQGLAVTEASQRRLFFERQFQQARDNLAKAETRAREGLDRGGLVKVDEQGRAMVETTGRLRGQITVKEVQIGAMRSFAADRNAELLRAEQELEVMKRQLAKIEGEGGDRPGNRAARGSGMGNLGLLRDVKYYEVIYELLAKQFEMAKIDEAKDSAVIQVLDPAIPPDFRSKPNRRNIVLLWGLSALILGIVLAFIIEAITKAASDPQQLERLQIIKHYLRWR
jgi:tyrosine-protein kinase Etk/Wzc